MRKPILSIALVYILTPLLGQTTALDFNSNSDLLIAENLYLSEAFAGAQYDFNKYIHSPTIEQQENEKAKFYSVLTSLQNGDALAEEKLIRFKEEYPKSIYLENSDWILGNYYLVRGDYGEAFNYLNGINPNKLSERKKIDYQFRMGYLQFKKGQLKQALNKLEPLMLSERYKAPAHYYVGHIYYQEGDFTKAFIVFDDLVAFDDSYKDKVKPYLMQIAFNQKKYDEAIVTGKELLNENRDQFIQSEASKIVGESLFQQENYEEAIPYLKAYDGEMQNSDYYQLGFANYQAGRYGEAVSYFNKITSEQSALGQTAYLQLGNSYLKQNQKQEAISAYKSASEMTFDKEIQENASFQYAKLSYDIGNPYDATSQVLANFIQKYPSHPNIDEINAWLVQELISSKNFKDALAVLDNIPNKNRALELAYDKATFLYGMDFYSKGNYNSAIEAFKQAKFNSDKSLQAQTYFWLGEAYFQSGKYDLASQSYSKAKNLNTDFDQSEEVNYSLAYAYFKQRKFKQAKDNFTLFINNNPTSEQILDAKMRLADSELALNNTERALALYEEILTDNSDYPEAAYNRAIVIGITGNSTQKISALEQFLKDYPKSSYAENAHLELADAYMREANYVRATDHLNDLIRNGSPAMIGRARLKKGLMFYNQSKNQEALEQYKIVAKDYKTSVLGQDAVDLAKRIYVEEGKISEFEKWATGLGYSYDAEEIQTLAYTEIQTLFNNKKYTEVVNRSQDFLSRYSASNYNLYVRYWLGESLYQSNQQNLAIPPFTIVASNIGDLQEEALLRLSQIYIDQKNETEALLSLEALEKLTDNTSYTFYAQMHLMRLYSKRNLHDKALAMADKIRDNSLATEADILEVDWVSARTYVADKKWKKAKEAYQKLEKASKNSIKAEALYYKAYFLNKDENYTQSNEVVFDLASTYTSEQFWGSKALVVMAKNYYALDDLYQATFTLEQVIANYKEYPEVVKEAQELLEEYKKK